MNALNLRKVVWTLLLALSVVAAAAFTSVLANAQEGEAPPAEAAAVDGGALFVENCGRCHGDAGLADSRMAERMEIQPFTAARMAELGDAGLRTAIEGHERNPVADLTPEQVTAIVAHALTLGQ